MSNKLEDPMAHHQSAKKSIRKNKVRTRVNKSRISRIRTFTKKVELAIASGDKAVAMLALRTVQPELDQGVTKGVLKLNTVSRKLSRLNARIKVMAS
jgi:small subunit ribosomal protein S20